MREIEIIERIRKQAAAGGRDRSIIRGIGDDCAILRPRNGEDLVFTSDFVLEDRHFTLKTHTPAAIGAKALARSLSDLAAMGAEPVFCLVSLAVPGAFGGSFIEQFYQGLMRVARRHVVSLAGGDLARFDKVVADVTCCGRVPRGQALLRSGAKAGHALYVTGKLGTAARAFEACRPILPEPRLETGIALRRLAVSAAIDLSDGLLLDLARLAKASGVSAAIDRGSLPVARGVSLEQAVSWGEDYELLFTAPAKMEVPSAMGKTAITRIGSIRRGDPGVVLMDGQPVQSKGFDHFA